MDGALLPADLQQAMGMSADELCAPVSSTAAKTMMHQPRRATHLSQRKSLEEIKLSGSVENVVRPGSSRVTTSVLKSVRASLVADSDDRRSQQPDSPISYEFRHRSQERGELFSNSKERKSNDANMTHHEVNVEQSDLQTPPRLAHSVVDQRCRAPHGDSSLSSAIVAISRMVASNSPLTSPSSTLSKRRLSTMISQDKDDGTTSPLSISRRSFPNRAIASINSQSNKFSDPVTHVSISSESTAASPDTNLKALIRLFTPPGAHSDGCADCADGSSLGQAVHERSRESIATEKTNTSRHSALSIPIVGGCSFSERGSRPEGDDTNFRHLSSKTISCMALPLRTTDADERGALGDELPDRVLNLESFQEYTTKKHGRVCPSRIGCGFQSPSSGTFLNKRNNYGNFDAQETLKRLLDCINSLSSTEDSASTSAASALCVNAALPAPTTNEAGSPRVNVDGVAPRRLFLSPPSHSATSSQESLSPYAAAVPVCRGSSTAPAAMMTNDADTLLKNLLDSLNCDGEVRTVEAGRNFLMRGDEVSEEIPKAETLPERNGKHYPWLGGSIHPLDENSNNTDDDNPLPSESRPSGRMVSWNYSYKEEPQSGSPIPEPKLGCPWLSSNNRNSPYEPKNPDYQGSENYQRYPVNHYQDYQHTSPQYPHHQDTAHMPRSPPPDSLFMDLRDNEWSSHMPPHDEDFLMGLCNNIPPMPLAHHYMGGGNMTGFPMMRESIHGSYTIMNQHGMMQDYDDDVGQPHMRKVYTDDRDRMVYVSWIPKKARAYHSIDKRRMELDLKRRLREDLGLTGLTKVLLFPPKGVHCKLIFDCRGSASTFMEVYGGDNRSDETEKWKTDLCRVYEIDMHDRFDKTVVKIEWSQK